MTEVLFVCIYPDCMATGHGMMLKQYENLFNKKHTSIVPQGQCHLTGIMDQLQKINNIYFAFCTLIDNINRKK